jgi:hypothetical protein
MVSELTLEDPLPFLASAGFPVTDRGDGTYDVANTFTAVSEEGVLEVYHRVLYWPDWPGITLGASETPQRLCGGMQEPFIPATLWPSPPSPPPSQHQAIQSTKRCQPP